MRKWKQQQLPTKLMPLKVISRSEQTNQQRAETEQWGCVRHVKYGLSHVRFCRFSAVALVLPFAHVYGMYIISFQLNSTDRQSNIDFLPELEKQTEHKYYSYLRDALHRKPTYDRNPQTVLMKQQTRRTHLWTGVSLNDHSEAKHTTKTRHCFWLLKKVTSNQKLTHWTLQSSETWRYVAL